MPASRARRMRRARSRHHAAVIAFCRGSGIDFVVVGPEAPLCAGIVDDLEAAGIKPSVRARPRQDSKAQRASPRIYAGRTASPPPLMNASAPPLPPKPISSRAARRSSSKPTGLAAGKGVVVAQSLAEAEAAVDMVFGGGLGEAGVEAVIEEFLDGEEASFFALLRRRDRHRADDGAGSQARL